jgi:Excalibur calcium-binding domain
VRSPSPLLVPALLAGLLLAGCGSDLPPTPTEPTWSTDSTSATASTTVTPVSSVPAGTEVAAGAGAAVGVAADVRRPVRTTVARPRRAPTPSTTAAQRPQAVRAAADPGTATSRATTSKTTTSKTTTTSGGSYRSCKEARAAGAAPLHAGQAGYSSKLDGDHDGVACEV